MMGNQFNRAIVYLVMVLFCKSTSIYANKALDEYQLMISKINTIQANFSQTVSDSSKKEVQKTEGL